MPKKPFFKRISFSRFKNKSAHLFLLCTALFVALFLYGSVNVWSKKLIEKTYMAVLGKPMDYVIKTDEKGVPYIDDVQVGRQRNPVTVCNTALNYYEEIQKGNLSHKTFFLNCADWLVDNRSFRNDTSSVLEYGYDWKIYNMTRPWQSGMAQGLSLQVLVDAHKLTKDEKYLKAAREQLNAFYVEVKDNGLTLKSADKGWWYEEFADQGGKESRVLNGMIFAVLGIYDYYQYTQSASAKFLFQQGVLAVKSDVALYDKDGFSYYDRVGTINLKYHWIHVDLLQKMYAASGEKVFKEYAERWAKYREPMFIVKVFTGEAKPIQWAIYLVNAFFLFLTLEVLFIFYLVGKKLSGKKPSAA